MNFFYLYEDHDEIIYMININMLVENIFINKCMKICGAIFSILIKY